MASVTTASWDGSASRWSTPEAYCASCLVDTNTGAKTKAKCFLPVKEPSGALNKNAVAAAWGALRGARGAQIPDKANAARKLMGLYRQCQMEIPPQMAAMAGRSG